MRGYSRHHVLYRGEWSSPAERQLSSHFGLIALIPNELHFDKYPESVHALVEPPIPPEYGKILGALSLLDSKPHRFLRHTENVLSLVADYFGNHGEEALGNNLYRQLDVFGGAIERQ